MVTTPNYAGMFLRGYGNQNHTKNNGSQIGNTNTNHASGQIGIVQGDSIRNFTGNINDYAIGDARTGWPEASLGGARYYDGIINRYHNRARWARLDGARKYNTSDGYDKRVNVGFFAFANLNASYGLPTANEVRPVNMAIRYLIKTR